MFWEKRKTNKYELEINQDEKRNAFRYSPLEDEHIVVIIKSDSYPVTNISAGGVAFNSGRFRPKEVFQFQLKFLNEKYIFLAGKLEIISTKGNLCRTKFINMHKDKIEKMHKFIFERQLKNIRGKKQNKI
ncbi:MAG: hypothetical protein CSB21_01945 [Deltaproteobacteria bacterium]|nr:MAG: hypothetical protein CSB21_01945 [Deltaproteobacteria bacterium]